MVKWLVELSKFNLQYEPQGPIKYRIQVKFITELTPPTGPTKGTSIRWILLVDGATNLKGSGEIAILEGPDVILIDRVNLHDIIGLFYDKI